MRFAKPAQLRCPILGQHPRDDGILKQQADRSRRPGRRSRVSGRLLHPLDRGLAVGKPDAGFTPILTSTFLIYPMYTRSQGHRLEAVKRYIAQFCSRPEAKSCTDLGRCSHNRSYLETPLPPFACYLLDKLLYEKY